ncbi:MAG: hypothetical protein ACP5IE_01370 [Infirmifilum sp.]
MTSLEQFTQLEYNIHQLVKPFFTAVSMYYTVGLSYRSKNRKSRKLINTGINWLTPHVLHIALSRLGVEHEIIEEERPWAHGKTLTYKYLRVNCKQLKQVGEEKFMQVVREVLRDIFYNKIRVKRGEKPWREKPVGYNVQ